VQEWSGNVSAGLRQITSLRTAESLWQTFYSCGRVHRAQRQCWLCVCLRDRARVWWTSAHR